MSGVVKDMAEERALRIATDLPDLDPDLASSVGDEMAAALARAANLPEPAEPAPPAATPLQAQWARFRDQFAEAVDGGLYTIDDLERMIFAGEAYFWPGADAALLAQRVEYPSGEAVMQTLWAVGDLAEVLTLEPGMAAAARLLGCSRILVEGRKGWERMLKPAGYKPWSVTLCREL